jgi:hypothetical protein
MTSQSYVKDESTGQRDGEVEYARRGRQMVRELESFLRAELAHPGEGRRISFLAARSNGCIGSKATVNPVKE